MKMVKERKDSMMGSTVMGTQCVRDGGGVGERSKRRSRRGSRGKRGRSD